MILKKELIAKATEWGVPIPTVEKDHVLGHVLAGIHQHFEEQMVFKGGTCLRKCYWPDYRFSEDLDFSSCNSAFVLETKSLRTVLDAISEHSGIQFYFDKIETQLHKDTSKGFKTKIKYWGANHSKNQAPTSPERWTTQIKLDISTTEELLLPNNPCPIHHPYSDELMQSDAIACYHLDEVVAEKLRSLVQRPYTAPRDFYDLFHLTKAFQPTDWERVKPMFLVKMKHKNIDYAGPEQLVGEPSRTHALRAWKTSIAHQIAENIPCAEETIDTVAYRIKEYL